GSDVRIEVSGRLEYTLPISIDRTVEVAGPLGKTIVEIKGSKVRIKDSPCHNRICVHEGWIDRGAIICLPNKVMVSVTGKTDKKSEGLDGITG
ncbi:MAG TPA: NusG domain II-containing protein, partial [Dissulfurispiraceae bacterium]